ncbi:MAG: hypothetical protein IH944_04065 [Armatimonadetes bacterium]|nr:hypothetical protein [Armatimonadota bacterium]
MLGIFMLVLATVALMSLYPVIKRGEMMSSDETKAVQMTTRLIEHIQMLGADDVNGQVLESLNLIDAGQTLQPYSFTHIPLDEASMYSPAQVLDDANGNLTITTLADGSKRVDIKLDYRSKSGELQTVQTGTVIGAFRG